jgi:hypothetical protein
VLLSRFAPHLDVLVESDIPHSLVANDCNEVNYVGVRSWKVLMERPIVL